MDLVQKIKEYVIKERDELIIKEQEFQKKQMIENYEHKAVLFEKIGDLYSKWYQLTEEKSFDNLAKIHHKSAEYVRKKYLSN